MPVPGSHEYLRPSVPIQVIRREHDDPATQLVLPDLFAIPRVRMQCITDEDDYLLAAVTIHIEWQWCGGGVLDRFPVFAAVGPESMDLIVPPPGQHLWDLVSVQVRHRQVLQALRACCP